MRFARFSLLIFLSSGASVWAQQPALSQQATTPAPAPQDPQAVTVLNQALAVAGGTAAITAVMDYKATGNITYNWNPVEQGTVTVLGLGFGQIRLDANLSRGIYSSAISAGQTTTKTEDGTRAQYPPAYPVPSSDAYPYQPPMFPGSLAFPHSLLVAVLNSPRFSVTYKGVVQVDGISAHDIQAQVVFPKQTKPDGMAEYHSIEIFIDVTTLQIVMTQDNVPKHIVHQVRYADFRLTSGVLVPFSISEDVGGQNTWKIQLSQTSFNNGLQDTAFVVQ